MTDHEVERLVESWQQALRAGLDDYRVHIERQLAAAGIRLQVKEYGVYWWRKEKEKR